MRILNYFLGTLSIGIMMFSALACSENPSNQFIPPTTRHDGSIRKDDKYIRLNSEFALSPTQLAEMKNKAIKGDGEASYRVYQYYAFWEYGGAECSMYWLNMAVTNGCHAAKEARDALRRCEESDRRTLLRSRRL